jgi:hypothetical protein
MPTGMELVIDYEILKGLNDEGVIKEAGLVADNVVQTFHFKSPYNTASHRDVENGLNWAVGHIPYDQLFQVLNEAVAGYVNLYSYGAAKCSILKGLLGRTVTNLTELGCPLPQNFRQGFHCLMPCHRFPNVRCATRHAHAFYQWLIYHFQAELMIRCPDDKSRHTIFVSGV